MMNQKMKKKNIMSEKNMKKSMMTDGLMEIYVEYVIKRM